MNDYDYIRSHVSDVAQVMQLAEEAAELSAAAMKLARVLDGSNPTPVSEYFAMNAMLEEYADVVLCAEILGVYEEEMKKIEATKNMKLQRWVQRLEELHGKQE